MSNRRLCPKDKNCHLFVHMFLWIDIEESEELTLVSFPLYALHISLRTDFYELLVPICSSQVLCLISIKIPHDCSKQIRFAWFVDSSPE